MTGLSGSGLCRYPLPGAEKGSLKVCTETHYFIASILSEWRLTFAWTRAYMSSRGGEDFDDVKVKSEWPPLYDDEWSSYV